MSPASNDSRNGHEHAALRIGVVCHENIARSQILHHYIEHYARARGLQLDVFSCGTGPEQTYIDVPARLSEVQDHLSARGLDVRVERTWWSDAASGRLQECDVILVAEEARRRDVLERLEGTVDPQAVMLFYEFIGEGPKDFVDTYDPDRGAQDPERFGRCFDELERIARLVVAHLAAHS